MNGVFGTSHGLSSARARGRNGGRPYTMTPAKLRLAQAAMAKRDTKVGDLCKELGVTRQTLYRFAPHKGELRADGTKLLKRKSQTGSVEDTCKMSSQTGFRGADALCEPANQSPGRLV